MARALPDGAVVVQEAIEQTLPLRACGPVEQADRALQTEPSDRTPAFEHLGSQNHTPLGLVDPCREASVVVWAVAAGGVKEEVEGHGFGPTGKQPIEHEGIGRPGPGPLL